MHLTRHFLRILATLLQLDGSEPSCLELAQELPHRMFEAGLEQQAQW